MTLFNKKLGAVLKNIRNERHLSQQEIADRLGVSRSCYTHYETGDRGMDINVLFKLCDIYNVDVNEILKDVRKYVYKK